MSDEPTQHDPNDATDVAECPDGPVGMLLDGEQAAVMVDDADPDDGDGQNGDAEHPSYPMAAPEQPGDAVLIVGHRKYPLSGQNGAFELPPALRQLALATLWSIIKSGKASHLVKIRAIEALVRIDQSALMAERQEDWRSVQSSNSNRSNIRVLAEMNRNKSQAKSLPKPRKS